MTCLPPRFKTTLRRLPGGPRLRRLYHAVRTAESRSITLLRLTRPPNLFQPYPTTGDDRYPTLFAFVRDRLGDGADRRILSFGCATGEEVFSLRRHFPRATIKGIDINPRNIRRCRQHLAQSGGDPGLSFVRAGSVAGEAPGSYDAVFAMAVFRHGDLGSAPARCAPLIRFADFEHVVSELADRLKPGGLLVIRHANFRFSDTVVAAGFRRIFSCVGAPGSPLYGVDDRLLRDGVHDDGVYLKTEQG